MMFDAVGQMCTGLLLCFIQNEIVPWKLAMSRKIPRKVCV